MIQGISEAAQSISFAAMAEHQQALADAILKDPDVVSAEFVHRRGRHQHHAEHRPLPDQSEAARRPRAEREPDHPPAAAGGRRCRGHRALPAAGAGPDDRCRRSAARSTSSCWRTPTWPSSTTWVPKLMQRLQASPVLADVASDLQQQGLALDIVIDRATAARFGITPATVDNALYDLFGQRIISTIYTQSNQYRVIMEADPTLQTSLNGAVADLPAVVRVLDHRAGAAVGDRASGAAAAGRCRSAISGSSRRPRSPSTSHPAPRSARRCTAIRQAETDIAPAGQLHHRLPGCRGGVPVLAVNEAAAGAGGDRHRLHRAGRALRELHPSDHDPVHAAVGRRGRAAGADDRRRRPRRHRHHRHHAADRHRQEERHHDDRLRARRRARGRASRRARRSIRRACCASGRS